MPRIHIEGLGNFNYQEHAGSAQESYTGQQMRVVRVYDVEWRRRWRFMQTILGHSRIQVEPSLETGNAVELIVRSTPHPYEETFVTRGNEDSRPWLYATQIQSVEGLGPRGTSQIGDLPEYELARVTVVYEALTYNVLEDYELHILEGFDGLQEEHTLQRYITRHIQPSTEALTIPRGVFYWATDVVAEDPRTPVPYTNVRIQKSMEVVYTWHQVPGIPANAASCLGCVNSQPFDPFWNLRSHSQLIGPRLELLPGFAAGTLLLVSMEVRPYRQITGHKAYDITYKMKYFEPEYLNPNGVGHNYFLRYVNRGDEETLVYTLITDDGTTNGRKVYVETPFSTLFRGPFKHDPSV